MPAASRMQGQLVPAHQGLLSPALHARFSPTHVRGPSHQTRSLGIGCGWAPAIVFSSSRSQSGLWPPALHLCSRWGEARGCAHRARKARAGHLPPSVRRCLKAELSLKYSCGDSVSLFRSPAAQRPCREMPAPLCVLCPPRDNTASWPWWGRGFCPSRGPAGRGWLWLWRGCLEAARLLRQPCVMSSSAQCGQRCSHLTPCPQVTRQ